MAPNGNECGMPLKHIAGSIKWNPRICINITKHQSIHKLKLRFTLRTWKLMNGQYYTIAQKQKTCLVTHYLVTLNKNISMAERQTNQTPMPLLTSHRLGIHNFRPKTPTRPSCPGWRMKTNVPTILWSVGEALTQHTTIVINSKQTIAKLR